MVLPREFEGWHLMPAGTLVSLWSEVGSFTFEFGGVHREWRIGRSEVSLVLFVFTDLPHPDDNRRKAVFSLNQDENVVSITDRILLEFDNCSEANDV